MSSLRKYARYRFDNFMSKGIGAQISLLGLATLALLLITAVALHFYGGAPSVGDDGSITIEHQSFARDLWLALMHTFDAGTLGGDPFAWGFLFIMLFVTIGGIFIVSALIGVINNGLGALIENLRRGRSEVLERGHTVILGFSPKVHTLLHELSVAGANQKDPCVVILADRDKVAMDEEVQPAVAGTRLRVVTRNGKPTSLTDLELVNLPGAKSVIVLAPEGDGAALADTMMLKTLLAVSKVAQGHAIHIVAELMDAETEAVARMVLGDKAALIVSPPLISRLLVQTGRQSGLSMVYQELLDFGGVEMYIQREDQLAGRSFRDAVSLYDTSTLMGVVTADDELLLPPAFDRVFVVGDRVIAISEDDDTVVLDGGLPNLDPAMVTAAPRQSLRHRERTLVLGASDRLLLVLRELDAYVAPGSETLVLGDGESLAAVAEVVTELGNQTVARLPGDTTNRLVLDGLEVASFDHILVLSETAGRDQETADARTMITLLHLRDILRKAGKKVPITSEILAIENRDLAAVAEADDFIVSNTLIALLMSQISESEHLVRVFDDLFTAGGHEIYLKPASEYVPAGLEVPYAAVVEAALRRGEVALGVRLGATSKDPKSSYGVIVNPPKRGSMRLGPADKIIVLSDD